MEMINLLVVNQYASTPEYSSGAGERFYFLAEQFEAEGIHTEVVSGSFNHLFIKYPSTPKLYNKELIPGGLFYWVRMRHYNGENFVERLYSWFEFLFKLFRFRPDRKLDVVIVSSMSIFPILYAIYLKKLYKIPIIFEVRDIWPLTPIELGGYKKSHPFIFFLSYLERIAYNNSDVLVSVLPGFNRHVQQVLGYEKPFTWIPNAIHHSILTPNIQSNKQSNQFRILYTGALGIANAMSYVIEAAAILKNVQDIELIIVGEGPEKENLVQIANEKKLDNVHFFNKIPKEDVIYLLVEADMCIISWMNRDIYSYGVSANKYNDYMMAEKPVLSASNIKDDPVLLAGCGIQVPPENPLEIANGILKLKSSSKYELSIMGKKGKEYVLSNNTYEVISKKYAKIIKNIIKF